MMIEFFVAGVPRPGGSKRAFVNKYTGKAAITDASGKKGKDWRGDVRCAAQQAWPNPPLSGALWLEIDFWMPRPKGHYGTGKNASILKTKAPCYHTSAPDTTKLVRSLEDSLTGICWNDDAQVARQYARKYYATDGKIGADVRIWEIGTRLDNE